MVYLNNNEKGQLLIIGGIIISIFIVISAVLTVNLSSTHKPVDTSTFIDPELKNVREKFGFALNDKMDPELASYDSVVYTIFNDTVNQFRFSELRHGYYFDAELISIKSVNDEPEGLEVQITLSNKKDSASELIYYYID